VTTFKQVDVSTMFPHQNRFEQNGRGVMQHRVHDGSVSTVVGVVFIVKPLDQQQAAAAARHIVILQATLRQGMGRPYARIDLLYASM
jgi:hypothetical protein